MTFHVLDVDPPWEFKDRLDGYSDGVKRGAESQYKGVLTIDRLKELPVGDLAADPCVLVLWCPSALLPQGLEVMAAWGFEFKQTVVWVKLKVQWLKALVDILRPLMSILRLKSLTIEDLDGLLAFFLGRIFRNCHEIALVGVRGRYRKILKDRSQRTVFFHPALRHSSKPEVLQDRLELMFPGPRLELFARRKRKGWTCWGNECPGDELDIRERIDLHLGRKK